MGLFKKNNIKNFEDSGDKTPIKFSEKEKLDPKEKKQKRKKAKRIIILALLVIFVAAGTFFGIKGYNSIKNIFEGETGILNLISGSQQKPLKGESEGRVNILLLGVGDAGHGGATLSDTIIILSLDTRKKSVAMFSIPRDLYVKIPKNGSAKINAAHAYGEQQKYPGGGPALAKETVEDNLGIPIHYFARVDFSGLEKVVDALGGVTINVERDFCDYDYPTERKGDTRKVCFKAGSQNMNGTKALQYARSRHAVGPEGSDFARSKRQQNLLMAIKDKALTVNTMFNPKKVLEMMDVLGSHVKTDLNVSEIARLYDFSKEIENSKIISKNFDSAQGGFLVASSGAAGYILQPKDGNFKAIKNYIQNIFSEADIKNEAAKIILLNGTYSSSASFAQVASELKESGFTVSSTGNADTRSYAKTVIFDYTNGAKPETIKGLEKKFGVTSQKRETTSSSSDIRVIIGRDYKF